MMRLIDADDLKDRLRTLFYEYGASEYDEFEQEIDDAPTVKDEWIPCCKRLPEKNDFYLVTKRQKTGEIQMAIGHYSKFGWSGSGNFSDVIAWMPLPESYQVERGDC